MGGPGWFLKLEEASAVSARSPCRQPVTTISSRLVAPGASEGKSQETSATNSRWPAGRVDVPQSNDGAASGRP